MEQPFIVHIQYLGRQVIYSHGIDLHVDISGYFVFSSRRTEELQPYATNRQGGLWYPW